MQEDKLQTGQNTDALQAQLFFWPGQQAMASHLADQLGTAEALAFDTTAVAAALRDRKTVVVLWRGPDADLAPCLTHGLPLAPALDGWKDKARRLAVLFRKNRRAMILAEGEALRSTGTEALAERLGVRDAPTLPKTQPPAPLGQALTHLALEQDADLRLLVEEMISSSLPMPEIDLGAVLALSVAQSAKASQGLSALQDDLAKSEGLRRQAETDRSDAKIRVDQLRGRLDQMEAAMTAEEASARAAAAEHAAALEGQISHRDQTIAKLSSESAALRAGLAKHQAKAEAESLRIATLEDHLAQQNDTFSARQADANAQAELLRAQLDINQSLLIEQSTAAQSASAEAAAAALRIAALEKALAKQEKQAAALLVDTNAISARLAQRDAEAQALRAQVETHKTALAAQSDTATAAAAAAVKRIGALEDQLAKHEQQTAALLADAKALNARLAERDAEAQALRAEADQHKTALTDQSAAGQASAEAAEQRIATLEDQLARQEKKAARLLSEGLAISSRLAEREAGAALQLAELKQAQSDLQGQADELRAAAQSSALQVSALEAMLAQQTAAATGLEDRLVAADQQIADISAALELERQSLQDALADQARSKTLLAERDGSIDLLNGQLSLVQDEVAQQVAAAMAQAEAAALRIKLAEEQSLAQEQARADLEEQTRALQTEIDQTGQALDTERARHAVAEAEKTRLAADLADRLSQIDLLSQQVLVLQEGLSQVVTSAADQREADAKAQALATADATPQRSDVWEKALARALAASRSEAELRAKLEQDLESMKAKLQSRDQRDADQSFNHKLFTQMTLEANASLDLIARLAAKGATTGNAEGTTGL